MACIKICPHMRILFFSLRSRMKSHTTKQQKTVLCPFISVEPLWFREEREAEICCNSVDVEALEAPPVTSLDSADNSALIIKTQTYTTKIMNTSTQCLQPARDYGNLIYPLNNFLFTRCLYIHFFYEKHSS